MNFKTHLFELLAKITLFDFLVNMIGVIAFFFFAIIRKMNMRLLSLNLAILLLFFTANCQQDFEYYSQPGFAQDRFLNEHVFHSKTNGTFVDIGAHDGKTFSNTYFFEKYLGWTGIAIEPLSGPYEKLKATRKCVCINAAVASKKGVSAFLSAHGYAEMLSGLTATYDPQHLQRLKNEIATHGGSYEIANIPTVRLNDILEEKNIKIVDYLSIDTEGSELEILQSIDYEKYEINAISVENNYNDTRMKSFLESKGFVLIAHLDVDEIYTRSSSSMCHNSPGVKPDLYDSIKTLPYINHGWFTDENKKYLIQFIEQLQPKIVVEIGSWLGLSTIEMASRLKNDSHLFAIDTWRGSIEHEQNPEWKSFLPTLFQQFLSNVKHKGLTHIIIPIRMDSLEAAQALDVAPQLVYIDASHDEESVFNDIINWYPKIAQGGICCGDDWQWAAVCKGVERAARALDIKTVHHGDVFWYFDPK